MWFRPLAALASFKFALVLVIFSLPQLYISALKRHSDLMNDVHEGCCLANSFRTLATTLPGMGYHKRFVSMTFCPSIETLNSPKRPLAVSTLMSFAFDN